MFEFLGKKESVDAHAPITGTRLSSADFTLWDASKQRDLEAFFQKLSSDEMASRGNGWFVRFFLRAALGTSSLEKRLQDHTAEMFLATQGERPVGMGFVFNSPDGTMRKHVYCADPEARPRVVDALRAQGYPGDEVLEDTGPETVSAN